MKRIVKRPRKAYPGSMAVWLALRVANAAVADAARAKCRPAAAGRRPS